MNDQEFKFSVVIIAIIFVATIFFSWTLFQLLQRIPKENQQFPSWFVWFFLVPYVAYAFQWIMLPFGIPNALKKTFSTNEDAVKAADLLFKLGLAQVVLMTFSLLLPLQEMVNQVTAVLSYILWIVYWVMVVKFRNTYLK